ncbi:S8 family serine peptidase [Candidatus Pacearchaeota archaeon]|nr:S8 family serine peptidase [Candidatus Pacearchaeota archaeon]
MKKKRLKIFNSINIILISLLAVELILVGNWAMTGNPVRGVSLDGEGENKIPLVSTTNISENKTCKTEICGRLDSDCDGLIDDPFLCDLMSKAKDSPKFNGYIVQLKGDSASQYYLKQKQDKSLSETKIKENTNSYRKNLVDKQNSLESKIKNIYPKAKIDSKIQNVFNGFAVFDISGADVEKIKNLPEVKSVSPNYEVHTTLMDSVPLINADDVWNIQLNGTNLTGEGVIIGIIDTGVDYTHPDLGGCQIAWYNLTDIVTEPVYLESDHPYSEGYSLDWWLGTPPPYTGYDVLSAHFQKIELRKDIDFLNIYDANTNELLNSYTGNHSDIWTLNASKGNLHIKLVMPNATQNTSTQHYGILLDFKRYTRGEMIYPPCEKVIRGWDFINNDADPIDDHGHGTHVASIAAGNGVLRGVAPDAKIYVYKVLGSSGLGFDNTIISAIERSADPNQDGDFSDHLEVISMSFGSYGNSDDIKSQVVDSVIDLGVVAVVSAGNFGPGAQIGGGCRHGEDTTGSSYSICSPGTARKAITVGASDKSDLIAGFSSRGPTINGIQKPDMTAPGVYICATQWDSAWESDKCIDNEHVAISGTSMSTPMVAGAVALIKQAHPDWTPEQIKQTLKNGAKNLGYDVNTQGAGRLDILNSLLTSCTDTDGGINYNTKGAVTITNSSGTFGYQDICLLKNNLREAYCDGNNLAYSTYSCPSSGKVCSDGVCRTSPSGGGPSCYYDKIKRAYVCK